MTLVFVSHSGRDGAQAANPDEELRRQRMRAARDGIVAALRSRHCDVWLDQEQLQPSDDWEQEIMVGVRDCDFAIVLLDMDAIDNPGFVLKEATILAYRRFMEPDFRFVTVALDHQVDQLLAARRTWQSVNLRRWQHMSAVDDDIPHLLERFTSWADNHAAELAAGRASHGALDETDEFVAALLFLLHRSQISQAALERTIRKLEVFDSNFTAAQLQSDRGLLMWAHQVGSRLLAATVEEIPPFLEALPESDELSRLGEVLRANWVALDVAACIAVARGAAGAAVKSATVSIPGPWLGDVSFDALARDLVERSRRTNRNAQCLVIPVGDALDERTAEDPAEFALWIQQQLLLLGDVTEGTSERTRHMELSSLRAHVVVRAGTSDDFAFVLAAIDLLPENLRPYLTFVVLVEPDIAYDAVPIDQSVAECWAYRKRVLKSAKIRTRSVS